MSKTYGSGTYGSGTYGNLGLGDVIPTVPLPDVRAAMSPGGLRLLEGIPEYEQQSTDVRAALHALGAELDLLEARLDLVRNAWWPQKASQDYLRIWESLVGIARNPPDKSLAQRRTSILAFLQSLKSQGSGLSWVEQMSKLIGTGWSYEEIGDNTIRILLPYTTVLTRPTGLSATGSGSGGTLAAGTYYYVVTAVNAYGETTASTPPQSVTTTGTTSKVTLDWGDVVGATGYRVYRGTSSSDMRRIALSPTASAAVDTGYAASIYSPPSVNTTESFRAYEAKTLARRVTPAAIELTFDYESAFIVGRSHLGDTI